MKSLRNFKFRLRFLLQKSGWITYRRGMGVRFHFRRWPVVTLVVLLILAGLVVSNLPKGFLEPANPSGHPPAKLKPLSLNLKTRDVLSLIIPGAGRTNNTGGSVGANYTHQQIITTVFWAGESADASNGYIANSASAWDEHWVQHYGGADAPAPRNGYWPSGFTPKENPFYVALPYSDINDRGQRKASASNCPLASQRQGQPYSWCKNAWVVIHHNGKTVYAQWEDTGPYQEDDTAYVFGSARPANTIDAKAGLDVSPAVRDYLGLQDVDTTDWAFVPASSVPSGEWTKIVTTSLGDSI